MGLGLCPELVATLAAAGSACLANAWVVCLTSSMTSKQFTARAAWTDQGGTAVVSFVRYLLHSQQAEPLCQLGGRPR